MEMRGAVQHLKDRPGENIPDIAIHGILDRIESPGLTIIEFSNVGVFPKTTPDCNLGYPENNPETVMI